MKHAAATALSIALIIAAAPAVGAEAKPSQTPARQIFGSVPGPTGSEAEAIGFYTGGCLRGGVELPLNGPAWQVMRPSRNRNWGHPRLVALIERLAKEAREQDGWPGLLVGDLAQPRGGPMLTGHASHQVGLDADVWLMPAPARTLTTAERETISAVSVVENRRKINADVWTEAHARLLRRAASYPEVERIFVNPPIKKVLCEWAKNDRSWLGKIRPWYGHDSHFHIRISCPKGDSCRSQPKPPTNDGCSSQLAYWLSDKPFAKRKEPPAKIREIMMSDLPKQCRAIATAK